MYGWPYDQGLSWYGSPYDQYCWHANQYCWIPYCTGMWYRNDLEAAPEATAATVATAAPVATVATNDLEAALEATESEPMYELFSFNCEVISRLSEGLSVLRSTTAEKEMIYLGNLLTADTVEMLEMAAAQRDEIEKAKGLLAEMKKAMDELKTNIDGDKKVFHNALQHLTKALDLVANERQDIWKQTKVLLIDALILVAAAICGSIKPRSRLLSILEKDIQIDKDLKSRFCLSYHKCFFGTIAGAEASKADITAGNRCKRQRKKPQSGNAAQFDQLQHSDISVLPVATEADDMLVGMWDDYCVKQLQFNELGGDPGDATNPDQLQRSEVPVAVEAYGMLVGMWDDYCVNQLQFNELGGDPGDATQPDQQC